MDLVDCLAKQWNVTVVRKGRYDVGYGRHDMLPATHVKKGDYGIMKLLENLYVLA